MASSSADASQDHLAGGINKIFGFQQFGNKSTVWARMCNYVLVCFYSCCGLLQSKINGIFIHYIYIRRISNEYLCFVDRVLLMFDSNSNLSIFII